MRTAIGAIVALSAIVLVQAARSGYRTAPAEPDSSASSASARPGVPAAPGPPAQAQSRSNKPRLFAPLDLGLLEGPDRISGRNPIRSWTRC
jgi:hypothetical protein